MSLQGRGRRLVIAAGLVIAGVLIWLILNRRGGYSYDLRFGTAFSDGDGLLLIVAAVIGTIALAGPRWGAALLVCFGALVMVLGVAHPCAIAFAHTPQFNGCSVSAAASALVLCLPVSASVCAAALALAGRATRSRAASATFLGVSATALLVSLFLPWYRATDEGRYYWPTGWNAFQRFDVYIAVVCALAVILALVIGSARRRDLDRLAAAIALLALSGAGLAFYRLFTAADPPSGGYVPLGGAYVTLAAFVAVAYSALAVRRASGD